MSMFIHLLNKKKKKWKTNIYIYHFKEILHLKKPNKHTPFTLFKVLTTFVFFSFFFLKKRFLLSISCSM